MTISIEDIMYEINFVEQVFKGLQDAENGKLISTEELLKRIEQIGTKGMRPSDINEEL